MADLLQKADGSLLICHLTGTVHGSDTEAAKDADPTQKRDASAGLHGHEASPVDCIEDALPTGSHNHGWSDGGCSNVGKKLLVAGNQTHQVQLQ